MKIILLLAPILLQACIINSTPRYSAKNDYDPFFERSDKSLEIRLNAQERRSPIHHASFYFVQKEQLLLYATLYKNPTSFYPDKSIYIKIDQKIRVLSMQNIENSNFRTSTENTAMVMKADSTMAEMVQSVSSTDNYLVKFKIPLDTEIEDELKTCKSLSIRFMSGGKSSTFDILELHQLKKVLAK